VSRFDNEFMEAFVIPRQTNRVLRFGGDEKVGVNRLDSGDLLRRLRGRPLTASQAVQSPYEPRTWPPFSLRERWPTL
jgi:hypothetical protein